MSDPSGYTVGWICALSKEFTAAKTMLDENHPPSKAFYLSPPCLIRDETNWPLYESLNNLGHLFLAH